MAQCLHACNQVAFDIVKFSIGQKVADGDFDLGILDKEGFLCLEAINGFGCAKDGLHLGGDEDTVFIVSDSNLLTVKIEASDNLPPEVGRSGVTLRTQSTVGATLCHLESKQKSREDKCE